MTDAPSSLIQFQQRFPDEAACAAYLTAVRWPHGFNCPRCGHTKAWPLRIKAWTYECAGCHKQTSVTAGTVLHGSKLPLTLWFWAAYLMATHSNGISARQLQHQLALGSYKTAWLLCAKLRASMVAGAVIKAKSSSSVRSKCKTAGPVPAVSASKRCPITRLPACIPSWLPISPPATAKTDGWSGYPGVHHDPHTVGKMAAHIVLPWTHRVFSNLKTWALGVYHGLRRKHLQSYLDEFVFRFNRRHHRHASFRSLLGIAAGHAPLTYKMLVSPEATV